MNTPTSTVRTFYGAIQLLAPAHSAEQRSGHRNDPPLRRVVRILGARQLVQATISRAVPTPAVLALGVQVDILHALSMAALAVGSRRWRGAATASSAIASAFAVAGILATRHASPAEADTPRGTPARLIQRWAQCLAPHLIPASARRYLLKGE